MAYLCRSVGSITPKAQWTPSREGAKYTLSFYRLQERPTCLKLWRAFSQIIQLGQVGTYQKPHLCVMQSGQKRGYENREAGLRFGCPGVGTSIRHKRP